MADSPLSGVGESLFRLGESRRKKKEESLDELVKRAQLAEAGYGIEEKPGPFGGFFGGGTTTLVQRPDYTSSKQLARQKSIYEIQKLKREAEGNYLSPAEQINLFKTKQQFGVNPMTGETIPEAQLRKPRFGSGTSEFGDFIQAYQSQKQNQQPGKKFGARIEANFTGGTQPQYLGEDEILRQQAVDDLQQAGYPITDKNISALIAQKKLEKNAS